MIFAKKCQSFERWGLSPQTPNPPPIANFWLRACVQVCYIDTIGKNVTITCSIFVLQFHIHNTESLISYLHSPVVVWLCRSEIPAHRSDTGSLVRYSSGLRNVQMHRGPPTSGGPPHLTYRAQKKFDYEKL